MAADIAGDRSGQDAERGAALVYRRSLASGRVAIITIDGDRAAVVTGRLQLERRLDPARQRAGQPPVLAVRRGARDEVLAALDALAADEKALAARLGAWIAAGGWGGAAGAPADGRRVVMGDGAAWMVARRHEMARLMTPATRREPLLFLFFYGPGGAMRRAVVAPDFPPDAPDDALRDAWARSDLLG